LIRFLQLQLRGESRELLGHQTDARTAVANLRIDVIDVIRQRFDRLGRLVLRPQIAK